MRIAMLSYRSKPHCGGQGIYLRHLSRELVSLGHTVEVFSGQPYPELDEGVVLTKVPSLDLYREPGPVPGAQAPRVPRPDRRRGVRHHVRGRVPEPKTFSSRVARLLRERLDDFDIAHDNQVLGYGMLEIEKMGLPLLTTIHHPITFDPSHRHRVDPQPVAQVHAQPLVRLPAHAEEGRQAGPLHPHPVGGLQARHRQGTSASTRPACRCCC